MKKYEGLFILNLAGREEGVKDALDKISNDITAVGGKIETVQKMEQARLLPASRTSATPPASTPTLFLTPRPPWSRSCRTSSR